MALNITGPVQGGSHGWPFGAAVVDVGGRGYVEEEYFFEGIAPRYRPLGELGVDGRWAIERAESAPFKTRAVVRRPRDPARFNGTVLVEWNNVSAGLEILEAGDTPAIFEEGFAYVGVSAQQVGVHGFSIAPQGLCTWDTDRYASLHVHDDGLSYGIFSEVARAFSSDRAGEIDPLGGLEVRCLLGIGGSQSAGRLLTYINAVQPIEGIFDGFVAFTWFGSGSSIDDASILDLRAGGLAALPRYPSRVRDDLGVPVMVVNSECETLSCFPVRQPDTDSFRYWEVAGAPHGPRLHMERILAKLQRDGVVLPAPADPAAMSPVPWAPVLDAALAHVHQWMRGGPPPPRQPYIDVAGDSPRIVRDADGNAVGGIRLPEHEVTLTRNVGAIEEAGPAGLMGITTALSPEVVRARYGDKATYVAAFEAAATAAVGAGVLRPSDAADAVERARSISFP